VVAQAVVQLGVRRGPLREGQGLDGRDAGIQLAVKNGRSELGRLRVG